MTVQRDCLQYISSMSRAVVRADRILGAMRVISRAVALDSPAAEACRRFARAMRAAVEQAAGWSRAVAWVPVPLFNCATIAARQAARSINLVTFRRKKGLAGGKMES